MKNQTMEAFMTTPIGDVKINSAGMRKLVDKLSLAIKEIKLYGNCSACKYREEIMYGCQIGGCCGATPTAHKEDMWEWKDK